MVLNETLGISVSTVGPDDALRGAFPSLAPKSAISGLTRYDWHTLQRKGVPSKLLYFPDEGHWVLKSQNSELWHKTIFEWLEGYLKK
jgi:hypothetical protein